MNKTNKWAKQNQRHGNKEPEGVRRKKGEKKGKGSVKEHV